MPHRSGTCSLCGGTIPAGAAKCLFCGTLVDQAPESQAGGGTRGETTSGQRDTHGALLVGIPVVMSAFVFAMVMNTSPLRDPMLVLLVGSGCVFLVSALLVWAEARKIEPGGGNGWSPIAWSASVLLLWPIGYPLYLRARATALRRDLWRYGVAISIGFCLLCAVLAGGYAVRRSAARASAHRSIGTRPRGATGSESTSATATATSGSKSRVHFRNVVPTATTY